MVFRKLFSKNVTFAHGQPKIIASKKEKQSIFKACCFINYVIIKSLPAKPTTKIDCLVGPDHKKNRISKKYKSPQNIEIKSVEYSIKCWVNNVALRIVNIWSKFFLPLTIWEKIRFFSRLIPINPNWIFISEFWILPYKFEWLINLKTKGNPNVLPDLSMDWQFLGNEIVSWA